MDRDPDIHQSPHMKGAADIFKDKDTRININPTINIKGTEY